MTLGAYLTSLRGKKLAVLGIGVSNTPLIRLLLGAGAEVYSSIGAELRAAAPGDTVLITHNASTLCRSHYLLDDETIARCDASRGCAMVPGYDEYRCLPGISRDLTAHVRSMASAIERRTQ